MVDQQRERVDQQTDGERGSDFLQDVAVEALEHRLILAQPRALQKPGVSADENRGAGVKETMKIARAARRAAFRLKSSRSSSNIAGCRRPISVAIGPKTAIPANTGFPEP